MSYRTTVHGTEVQCDTLEELEGLVAFREEHPTSVDLDQVEDVLRVLVESLPKCDCGKGPATKAYVRGQNRYCDECAPASYGLADYPPPDYPRAPALRRATKLLSSASGRLSAAPPRPRPGSNDPPDPA